MTRFQKIRCLKSLLRATKLYISVCVYSCAVLLFKLSHEFVAHLLHGGRLRSVTCMEALGSLRYDVLLVRFLKTKLIVMT